MSRFDSSDVLDAPEFPVIAPEFAARSNRSNLVIAHKASFDIEHLRETRVRLPLHLSARPARLAGTPQPSTQHLGGTHRPQFSAPPRPGRSRSRRTRAAGDDETREGKYTARVVAKAAWSRSVFGNNPGTKIDLFVVSAQRFPREAKNV